MKQLFLLDLKYKEKLPYLMFLGNVAILELLNLNFLSLVKTNSVITLVPCCPSNKMPHD